MRRGYGEIAPNGFERRGTQHNKLYHPRCDRPHLTQQDSGFDRKLHLAHEVDEVLSRQLAALAGLLQGVVHHRRHVVDQNVLWSVARGL